MLPNMFMGSTCMKKQMHAQQSRSCGMQDFKNKYCIYSQCVYSCYQIHLWAAPIWRSRCKHRKVEAVACRTLKINIVFTATVSVHVTKPVCQIYFYSLLGNHLVWGGSEQATWGQDLGGRPPCLHPRSLAFQAYKEVLHYDSPLDPHRGQSPRPHLGVAASGARIVFGGRFANWPSGCAYSQHASVTCRISPLLTTFPNCCIVVYLQSLLGLLWNNAVSSNCMWTSLLLSPIAGATSPRLSTPPFNGIGFAVDAISYTMWWTWG